jgi:tRNA(His) 5'-end guanylyltransferase
VQGTIKKDKNELLLDQFSISYDTLSQVFRKGSCLIWATSPTGRMVVVTHEDLIGESFWTAHPDLLV